MIFGTDEDLGSRPDRGVPQVVFLESSMSAFLEGVKRQRPAVDGVLQIEDLSESNLFKSRADLRVPILGASERVRELPATTALPDPSILASNESFVACACCFHDTRTSSCNNADVFFSNHLC